MSEGLALVAIQRRVWVSSLARLFFSLVTFPWFSWFSMNLLPKITAKGVMRISEARLMICDVFRDSLEDSRKTKVRMMLAINACRGSKNKARANRRISRRKKKGELRLPVEKIMRRIRLKNMVVVKRDNLLGSSFRKRLKK